MGPWGRSVFNSYLGGKEWFCVWGLSGLLPPGIYPAIPSETSQSIKCIRKHSQTRVHKHTAGEAEVGEEYTFSFRNQQFLQGIRPIKEGLPMIRNVLSRWYGFFLSTSYAAEPGPFAASPHWQSGTFLFLQFVEGRKQPFLISAVPFLSMVLFCLYTNYLKSCWPFFPRHTKIKCLLFIFDSMPPCSWLLIKMLCS